MGFLGEMYGTGVGVPQNNETARVWLEKAVAKKSAIGYTGLGALYYHGQGVERDLTKAFKVPPLPSKQTNSSSQ